jgi:glucose dehydrogenase
MYATGSWSFVYALNAKTGELLWKYDPKVPKSWGPKGCCGGGTVWDSIVYDED